VPSSLAWRTRRLALCAWEFPDRVTDLCAVAKHKDTGGHTDTTTVVIEYRRTLEDTTYAGSGPRGPGSNPELPTTTLHMRKRLTS